MNRTQARLSSGRFSQGRLSPAPAPVPTAAVRSPTPAISTITVETEQPRVGAMAYAKRLIREHGLRLSQVNYRRGPDGVLVVSAPGHSHVRFAVPVAE